MSRRHLAEFNIARIRYPLDDPRMAEFVDNVARVNALAEQIEGFVWRLQDESGHAMNMTVYGDPTLLPNLTLWENEAALERFVWQTLHGRFYRRREDWFVPIETPLVLWWVPAGHRPSMRGRGGAARAPEGARTERRGFRLGALARREALEDAARRQGGGARNRSGGRAVSGEGQPVEKDDVVRQQESEVLQLQVLVAARRRRDERAEPRTLDLRPVPAPRAAGAGERPARPRPGTILPGRPPSATTGAASTSPPGNVRRAG